MKPKLTTSTLRALIENSAAKYPHKLALALVNDEESHITYKALINKIDAMATNIIKLGLNKNEKIALVGESQPTWAVAYFAIVSSGSIAVPILPEFSSPEIVEILNHSEAKAVVVSSRLYEKCHPYLTSSKAILIRLEDLFYIPSTIATTLSTKEEFLNAPGRDMVRFKIDKKSISERTLREDEVVSIIYTSGTTGASKGVMLTNKNLISNASSSTRQFFKVKSGMRFLSILPLSHSYEFTIGLLLPLLTGCEIHYLGRPPSPSFLLPALLKVKPHVMLSVPLLIEKVYRSSVVPQVESNPKIKKLYQKPFLRRFINSVIGKKLLRTFGGKLKFFGVGGAALDVEVEKFLKEAKFPYAIGYGLTETSPLIAGSGPKQTKVGTVGPPLKGVTIRLDNVNSETKVGEVVVTGPNVMVGYYKDEKLTQEAFTSDTWFKTGDLGKIERNRLSITGRSKTMILGPGGENIYPESIEAKINFHPFVEESLVLLEEGGLAALIKLDIELMAQNLKISVLEAKETAGTYLAQLKEEVNKEMSSFSRLRQVKLQDEPFQRTPTLKIKRYLYQLKKTITKEREEE